MKKQFRVGFWYTEYGTSVVTAKTAEEAEEILQRRLEDDGLDGLVYECNDRDYGAQDGEALEPATVPERA